MADASLRSMGKVCLDTVLEGSDIIVEEKNQTTQRRSLVSENAKHLVLQRKPPSRGLFRDGHGMMEYAREILRPRQLKLARIKEIVLSNSSQTKNKYIKLVYVNKGKRSPDESLKLVFDDSSMFSRWTLALSALVYIWKWLEMSERKPKTEDEREAQIRREQRQIHELGPTGKQLVSDLLCSLIVNEKIRKKYWSRVSKLLTELDFWNWRLPTKEENAQREMVFNRIHGEEEPAQALEPAPEPEEEEEAEESAPIPRRNSAPVVLSSLNELYTIPEDLESVTEKSRKVQGQRPAAAEDAKVQKIFKRVSNHSVIDYTASSSDSEAAPASDREDEDGRSDVMRTRVVHPLPPPVVSDQQEAPLALPPPPAIERDAASADPSTSAPSATEASPSPQEGEEEDCDGPISGGAPKCEVGYSKDFFLALNTLERKSKWKRKLRHMKSIMITTLCDVEADIENLEERIKTSNALRYHQQAAEVIKKAESVVDEDVFKAALWRTVVQLSMDLQKEREEHKKTKFQLAASVVADGVVGE